MAQWVVRPNRLLQNIYRTLAARSAFFAYLPCPGVYTQEQRALGRLRQEKWRAYLHRHRTYGALHCIQSMMTSRRRMPQ